MGDVMGETLDINCSIAPDEFGNKRWLRMERNRYGEEDSKVVGEERISRRNIGD